ncbi:uncharacterized protein ACMZJ9_006973 [Mantella aurantiaca]
MIPCLMVCQAFVCLVLGGQIDKVYTGSLEDDGDKNGIQAIESENQVHVGFEPSSVRTFLPARSCHVTFNNDFGTFSPPVFLGQIDVSVWCNWTILAAPGKHIVIYIDGFHTNTNCDDNDDEIIFERITSSIETTIVPACLNKPRHVFAAQAMAVNVVLLWRTFPHTGSSKYFEGRYYIFDDPVAGLNDHSCNCSLKPYKSMTKTAVTTVPKGPPTNLLPVFSSVSPILSTSKLPNIGTKVSEIHYDQEQPATTTPEIYYDQEQPATTTPQSPLHIGYNLTAGSIAISLLKDVQSTEVQASSPPSEALQPSRSYPSFPSVMDKDKLTDGETTGDLQPSYVGQWEPTSSSEWTKGKTLSLSETPRLSTAHTDISVTPYFSGAQYSELHATPHFSTTYPTDLPVTLDYDTTHVAKLPKATLSMHYTAKLPKTPHFGISHTKLDVTKQISTTNKIHVPMSTHVNDALFSELNEIYNFSKGQFASAFVTPPVSATLQMESPPNYVTSNVKRTKLPKSSHINKEEITETPKTILNLLNIESHLEKPTSVPPLSWQRSLSAVSATIKHVISSDMRKIETSTTTFSPVQFTSLPDEKIIANQVGTHVLKSSALLPTKTLSKQSELDSQTAREPLGKSQVFHPVSLSTIHPEYNLQKAKPKTSVQGIQMNVFYSSYSTSPSAIETVSGFSPQKVLVLGQEILHPSYQPKFEVKPMLFESSIQVAEAEKEMDVTKKSLSKITEIQTLPTEKNKSSELFPRFIGLIGHWFGNPSLHDSGRESKTTTQHVTSTTMPHKSSSTQVLISFPLSLPHSPTNNLHQSPDEAIIKGTKMAASDQDHSTIQSKSHANDHFDLNQKEAGQSRINDFDISENQTDLRFPHQPGDSLFKITAEIQHRNVKLKKWKKERIEIVKAKIIEKITYVPSGINSLILKDVTLTNPKKLTLTFWLHLQVGGKGVRNSITTQVKALEGQLIGTVGAALVSLSVEDVNECQLGIQRCDVNAECANEFGSYTCQCMKGYEDHSPAAPGTVCITLRLAEVYSLSGQMEILVASLGGVAITLLLLILLLCIVQLTRHSKANFILRKRPRESQDAHFAGALHAFQGECGQMMPSIEGHMSPRQSKEQHTARDTSRNLQWTNITFEQTAC